MNIWVATDEETVAEDSFCGIHAPLHHLPKPPHIVELNTFESNSIIGLESCTAFRGEVSV